MATDICLGQLGAVAQATKTDNRLLAGVKGYRTLCNLDCGISSDFPLKVPENDNGSVQFKNPNNFKLCISEFRIALDDSLWQVFHTMDHILKAVPEIELRLDKVEKHFTEKDKSKIDDLVESYMSASEEFLAEANSNIAGTVGKLERAIGILNVIIERCIEAEGKENLEIKKLEAKRLALDEKIAAMNEQPKEPKPATEEPLQEQNSASTFGAELKSLFLCCRGREARTDPPKPETRNEPTAEEKVRWMTEQRHNTDEELKTKEDIAEKITNRLEMLEQMRAQWTALETTLKEFSTTFNTKLGQRLTMYMKIAKKQNLKLQLELKSSSDEVQTGCNAICTFANCFWNIHMHSLRYMMEMFSTFISNKATDADRLHLNELVGNAERIIEDAASGRMGPWREALTGPPVNEMTATKD